MMSGSLVMAKIGAGLQESAFAVAFSAPGMWWMSGELADVTKLACLALCEVCSGTHGKGKGFVVCKDVEVLTPEEMVEFADSQIYCQKLLVKGVAARGQKVS